MYVHINIKYYKSYYKLCNVHKNWYTCGFMDVEICTHWQLGNSPKLTHNLILTLNIYPNLNQMQN